MMPSSRLQRRLSAPIEGRLVEAALAPPAPPEPNEAPQHFASTSYSRVIVEMLALPSAPVTLPSTVRAM